MPGGREAGGGRGCLSDLVRANRAAGPVPCRCALDLVICRLSRTRRHGPVPLVRVASVRADHVGESGAHAEDQDWEAGDRRGDAPRRVPGMSLGQQVVGDLPGHAEDQGADCGPAGEAACPGGDRGAGGEPCTQRVSGISLDTHGQGNRGVQAQGIPNARERADLPETGRARRCRPTRTRPRPPRAAPGPAGATSARAVRGPGRLTAERDRQGLPRRGLRTGPDQGRRGPRPEPVGLWEY